ncbi:MAG: zf-HC2 domain-containing protein [Planctomycetes bacterium]|nr:zf-HC2 domain-containing protein [Planctomycetota bacterium]MBI3844311.1 zf-HC2 domain-containing protein [Planctomycetota bacterium]
MRCDEALDHIDLHVTGDLGAIAALRLRRHLFGCRSCYAELRRARTVHGVVDDYVGHLRPRTSLRDRVMRDIAETPSPITSAYAPERARRTWIAPLAAAAAVLAAGVTLWAMLQNRAATDDILARVTRIEGRALYTAPGERRAVPLGVDDAVVSEGRVEAPDGETSALETDGGAVRYDVGDGGAFRLRRGPVGKIVVYERGTLGITTQQGGDVAEVRTPGGSIVPQDEAIALAITPIPARDNAHRIELRRGRVEVRNPDGTLALDAPNVAVVEAGFAPEPWHEPVPPAVVAPPPSRPPAAAVAVTAKPTPSPRTARQAVSAFQEAAVALAMLGRRREQEVIPRGSDFAAVQRSEPLHGLLEKYDTARKEVISFGADAITAIFGRNICAVDAEGPMAECVEAIAAANPNSSAVDNVIADHYSVLSLFGMHREWRRRPYVYRGSLRFRNLFKAAESPEALRDLTIIEELKSTSVGGFPKEAYRVADEFSRRLVDAYRESSADEAWKRAAVDLLAVLGAVSELREIEGVETDLELKARIRTYVELMPKDAWSFESRLKSALARFETSPESIESDNLDPATVVELLLTYRWMREGAPNDAWARLLEDAFFGRRGILGRPPTELMQRTAAVALARWAARCTDEALVDRLFEATPGTDAPAQVLYVAFIQGREEFPVPKRGKPSATVQAMLDGGWAFITAQGDAPTVGDVAWSVIEKANTSTLSRRWGEWNFIKR